MNMPLFQLAPVEPDALLVGADDCLVDRWIRAVDLGAAIAGLVDVREGLGLVGCDIAGALGVDLLGEGEFEAVGFGFHFENLEGDFAGPGEGVDGGGVAAAPAPAPGGGPGG